MLLDIAVTAPISADPASPELLSQVNDAAARASTAWTEPVCLGVLDQERHGLDLPDDMHVLHYQTDAVPR